MALGGAICADSAIFISRGIMNTFTVLAVGDVVGSSGCDYLSAGGRLRKMRDRFGADFVIVNGENSAKNNGITRDTAEIIFDAGADVITGGNHTFKQHKIGDFLDGCEKALRPANYPSDVPGNGYCIAEANGKRVLVINLLGTTFMEPLDSPFKCAENILNKMRGKYDISVIDIHAEATSEKLCLARYFDGRVSAVFGTHTHVRTADAQVLPGGTGYMTDLGMTGSEEGVLGVKTECIIHKFTKRTPVFFEPAGGKCSAGGAVFTFDAESGKCIKAESISF